MSHPFSFAKNRRLGHRMSNRSCNRMFLCFHLSPLYSFFGKLQVVLAKKEKRRKQMCSLTQLYSGSFTRSRCCCPFDPLGSAFWQYRNNRLSLLKNTYTDEICTL